MKNLIKILILALISCQMVCSCGITVIPTREATSTWAASYLSEKEFNAPETYENMGSIFVEASYIERKKYVETSKIPHRGILNIYIKYTPDVEIYIVGEHNYIWNLGIGDSNYINIWTASFRTGYTSTLWIKENGKWYKYTLFNGEYKIHKEDFKPKFQDGIYRNTVEDDNNYSG